MKLKDIYQKAVQNGIDHDPRGRNFIQEILKQKEKEYNELPDSEKKYFDLESLKNPFSDTRIINGDNETEVKSILAGIDIDTADILLSDRLSEKGRKIDLVISHHPQGKALVNFYEVMDLQADIFSAQGISISQAEKLLEERKSQVERRIIGINYNKTYDAARILGVNLICLHTPCDNMAYDYLKKLLTKKKPRKIEEVMNILMDMPEYQQAAKSSCPPKILNGSKNSRVKNLHIEFTGGTEGPINIYKELANKGIDTIISMHMSEEHFRAAKENRLNVIIAGHMSSDTLGVNLMLDAVFSKEKITVTECGGFRRFSRKK